MARLVKYLHPAGRALQVIFGFTAMGFAIGLSRPYDTPIAITVSAAFCSGGVAALGLLSTLAMSNAGDIHWLMVMTLDLLALSASIAASGLLTDLTKDDYWYWVEDVFFNPGILYPPLVLNYACLALLMAMGTRSFMLWRRNRQAPSTALHTKEVDTQSWYSPVEEHYAQPPPPPQQHQYVAEAPPRFSRDRHSDVKSTTSPRPLSTVESMAHWSNVSDSATLAHHASFRSSDTKSPPSYASPVPSRAATTIHRKPLN